MKPKKQPQRQAKAAGEKMYRIKPLRWREYSKICYVANTPTLGVIKVWRWVPEISSDTTWHIDRTTNYPRGQSLTEAMKRAESWYRQQLRKALSEVK